MLIPAVRLMVNRFYVTNVVRPLFFYFNFWSHASFCSIIFKKPGLGPLFFWNDTKITSRQFILAETCSGELFTKSQIKYVEPRGTSSLIFAGQTMEVRGRIFRFEFTSQFVLLIVVHSSLPPTSHGSTTSSRGSTLLSSYETHCISWLYRHQHLLRSMFHSTNAIACQ